MPPHDTCTVSSLWYYRQMHQVLIWAGISSVLLLGCGESGRESLDGSMGDRVMDATVQDASGDDAGPAPDGGPDRDAGSPGDAGPSDAGDSVIHFDGSTMPPPGLDDGGP